MPGVIIEGIADANTLACIAADGNSDDRKSNQTNNGAQHIFSTIAVLIGSICSGTNTGRNCNPSVNNANGTKVAAAYSKTLVNGINNH